MMDKKYSSQMGKKFAILDKEIIFLKIQFCKCEQASVGFELMSCISQARFFNH